MKKVAMKKEVAKKVAGKKEAPKKVLLKTSIKAIGKSKGK